MLILLKRLVHLLGRPAQVNADLVVMMNPVEHSGEKKEEEKHWKTEHKAEGNDKDPTFSAA